jgi:hypothetical protein
MCGINRDLWQLGFEHYLGGDAMACTVCISELAMNIGYAPEQPLQDIIVSRETEIAELQAQINRIPNHTEGLINAIRTNVSDFVFTISSIGNPGVHETIRISNETDRSALENHKSADISFEAHRELAGSERPNGVPADSGRNKPGRPRKG